MENLTVNIQQSSATSWSDEKGTKVPYSYVSKFDKLTEKKSGQIVKKALQINQRMVEFKKEVSEICEQIYTEFMLANAGKTGKGNFTWFNFDRSIKIEVSINDRIEFDDLHIEACKSKLDEFLEKNVESSDEFIKQMVLDAFETSRGNLDAKKVMSLLRYKSKIKSSLFSEAMELLEKSIRKPDSKKYFRIWAKDMNGKYQNVDLNFSSL